ncbi:hypothetical protein [Acaryochloris sp. IP29b_bin.137]|uniref:hypothetical protein n=1 Tax=Acaryochloris sp. IP29b_bin.137 TaxID=2969217 RepID=UPI002615B10F|nr:hypothetical protein [Acaryochloris sp. IP29b_bin.137]
MWNKIILILGFILITACQPSLFTKSAPTKVSAIEGTKAERIKAVTKLLVAQEPLPSPLQDAYFLEEQIGDNKLGPSDYVAFGMLEVKPNVLPAWRSKLLPLKVRPNYVTPKTPKDWWVSAADYSSLELFKLRPYTQRLHGWIGIDAKTNKIYIYTFTT